MANFTFLRRAGILSYVLVIWLGSITLAFLVLHATPPAGFAGRLVDAGTDLLISVLTMGACVAAGWRLTNGPRLVLAERFALAGAVGFGFFAMVMMFLAWLGWLKPGIVLSAVFLFLAAGVIFHRMRTVRRDRRRLPTESRPWNLFSILLAVFVGVTLLFSFTTALAPPLAWDALVYHLHLPAQMAVSGSLSIPGDSFFREMPQMGELVYAAGMTITGRGETAAVIGWMAGVMALLGITGTALRWNMRYPLLPAALLLASDSLARSMGWAYIDWITAWLGFGVLCAFSRRRAGIGWVALAGWCAGCVVGVKYTAAVVMAAPLLLLITDKPRIGALKEALTFLGCVLAAMLPWFFRNQIWFGSFLSPMLDPGLAAALRMQFFRGVPLPNALLIMWFLPIWQSIAGKTGTMPFNFTLGPLLLAFLPGIFLRVSRELRIRHLEHRMLLLQAVVYWAVVGIGSTMAITLTQPRLYMVLFPALALLAARGFEGIRTQYWGKVPLVMLAGCCTGAVLAFQFAGMGFGWIQTQTPLWLTGSVGKYEFLETNLGWYARAMERLRALPENADVILLWEPRGLYCGPVCREDSTIDRWILAMRTKGTAEAVLADWRVQGVTHVLVYDTGAEFERENRPGYYDSDWRELDDLRSRLTLLERFGGAYSLYAIP